MDLMNFESLDLDTVPGTEEERKHWKENLEAEKQAKERNTKLQEGRARIEGLEVTLLSTKTELEKSVPDALIRWACGGPHKEMADIRRSLAKYTEQIDDCEAALILLKKRLPIDRAILHADAARRQIERRLEDLKKQDEEKKA